MKKNTLLTKSLSVFLAVLMMLSVVSVGIIVPETRLTASAATYTVTSAANANTAGDLEYAIQQINAAGSGTIQLGADITASGLYAYTAITGNAVFDFNGHSLTFSYVSSLSDGESDNADYQLPRNNAGTNKRTDDYLSTALINVAASGSLQIINSSSTAGTLKSYAKVTHPADAQGFKDRYYTASSNLIYSEGNVTIGDKNDSGKNNFTLLSHAIVYSDTKWNDYSNCYAYTVADTVTINGANAKFQMYGGTVNAEAYSCGKRTGYLYSRCFSLNLVNCYCAEIYGGSINIVRNEEGGFRNADSTETDGGTGFFAAIRIASQNVYIFNVSSSVEIYVTADTDQANASAMNIYVTSDSALPCIYGGTYVNSSSGSDSGAGWDHNYTILGKFSYAEAGSMKPGTDHSTTVNGTSGWQYVYRSATPTQYFYTAFYMADTNTENGLNPWGYATFRDYLNSRTASNEAYNTTCGATKINDGTGYTFDTNYAYRRNGYTQVGWLGAKTPATAGSTQYANTGAAGFSASAGGSVYLYPQWSENTYTITYNLNDSTQGNGNGTATNASGAPTSYKITSTSTLPLPTRNGYYFNGWELTAATYPSTDTAYPWDVTSVYAPAYNSSTGSYSAAASLNGKNGNITLKALWTEVPYTVTFDYDNIPTGLSGTKTVTTTGYNINSTFFFPDDCQKEYYAFNNSWVCTTGNGNWTADSTAYGAGDASTSGKYGNPTFTAKYTPIDYYITFDTVNGTAVTPNYTTDASNTYKYNYESTDTLPAITRLGYTFVGWKPTTTVTDTKDATLIVWDQNTVYPAGTSLNHRHNNVTLVAQWESISSTVTLNIKSGENYTGNTTLNYAYSSSLALNNPTKTGYTFKGWKVTGVPTTYSSDIPEANRWIYGTEYLLGSESYVTLPAGKVDNVTLEAMWTPITYTVTYNSNGGSNVSSQDFTIESGITLGTPTYAGYDFTGWTVSSHDTVYNWTSSSYSASQSLSGMYGNVTLYANWQAKNYTVTLNVNGGDSIVPNTRSYNIEGSTALPTPTRTGYSFDGWKVTSKDASCAWTINDIYTDALPAGKYGSLTLTAQWTHTAYTITLNSTGTNAGDRTYYIDSAAFTLGASELAGYKFLNWKVNSNSGNWTKDEVLPGTATVSGRYGDVALTAQFSPITYTITYKDKDGGTLETVNYDIEDTVTLRDYSVNGYTFGGWQVESVTSGGGWSVGGQLPAGELSANMYYGNVVLTPVMTANEYTVTFIPNGGSSYAPVSYTVESTDTLPTSTKTGYDFAGWKVTVAGGSWTENTVFNAGEALTGKYGNVTLTATWTPKKYTITYFTGTYPSGITKQGTYAQTAPDLTDAEKAKPADAQYTYTFDHWNPTLTTVTGETSYTAIYSKTLRSYNITWMIPDDLGGTLGNYTSTVTPNVNYGETPIYNNGVNPSLASDSPSDYSWRFAGWSLTQGGSVLSSIPTVTGTATYYAVFTKVLAPEEVNWVINGVTNTELWGIGETPIWNHDTPSKPDADGYKYTFTGWSPTIVAVTKGNTYTYTAQFSKSLQTYTCTFNVNGGEMTDTDNCEYSMGDIITFPTATKTGYTFSGWLIDSASGTWTAGTLINAGNYVTNTLWGNISFTAQWTPVQYTISYSAASAEDVLPANKTYTIESTDTIDVATREGYDLAGWVVSAGQGSWSQGTSIAADYALNGDYGNVTLTPVWQIKTYIIHWISDGAEQTSEVEYGSAILSIPPSSKMGYTTEWDAEVPATMPANDLYFNAVYTPVEYYIRVNVNGGSAVENFYYTINGDDTLPSPTREGAEFAGWKVTAAQGNWSKNTLIAGGTSLNGKYGNVTLTAQWSMRTCTVIWNAGDTVKTSIWYYGAVPSYSGTPFKSPDEYNSYVFTGWDREITAVTEDEVTYTAQFEATQRIYKIIWNVDGVTTEQEYGYGETPVYEGTAPTRAETSEYVFTFTGWANTQGGTVLETIPAVAGDTTYFAQFDVFTKIQGLSLTVSSVFLDVEETGELTASIYPSTATVRDVVWTSLDESVATVNNGIVTAVDPGMAIIKVSSIDGTFSSYCAVSVNARITSYVEITANGVSTTQMPGTSIQLYASVKPDNATNPGIVWTSSSPSVASVSSDGLVTYNNAGTAVITATSKDGYSVGSITVQTATQESEVEESVTTYLVSFAAAGTLFVFNGKQYETLQLKVEEGETLNFSILYPDTFYVNVNGEVIEPNADGTYTITVDRNMAVITLPLHVGTDVVDEDKDNNDSPSFWAKLQAFFKKIVAFFRNLFN